MNKLTTRSLALSIVCSMSLIGSMTAFSTAYAQDAIHEEEEDRVVKLTELMNSATEGLGGVDGITEVRNHHYSHVKSHAGVVEHVFERGRNGLATRYEIENGLVKSKTHFSPHGLNQWTTGDRRVLPDGTVMHHITHKNGTTATLKYTQNHDRGKTDPFSASVTTTRGGESMWTVTQNSIDALGKTPVSLPHQSGKGSVSARTPSIARASVSNGAGYSAAPNALSSFEVGNKLRNGEYVYKAADGQHFANKSDVQAHSPYNSYEVMRFLPTTQLQRGGLVVQIVKPEPDHSPLNQSHSSVPADRSQIAHPNRRKEIGRVSNRTSTSATDTKGGVKTPSVGIVQQRQTGRDLQGLDANTSTDRVDVHHQQPSNPDNTLWLLTVNGIRIVKDKIVNSDIGVWIGELLSGRRTTNVPVVGHHETGRATETHSQNGNHTSAPSSAAPQKTRETETSSTKQKFRSDKASFMRSLGQTSRSSTQPQPKDRNYQEDQSNQEDK